MARKGYIVGSGNVFDVYRAIRARVSEGTGCIVNSSDAMELAGICDRVLVFSRGRIVRELAGDAVTEHDIVASFLTSRDEGRSNEAAAARGGIGSRIIEGFG